MNQWSDCYGNGGMDMVGRYCACATVYAIRRDKV